MVKYHALINFVTKVFKGSLLKECVSVGLCSLYIILTGDVRYATSFTLGYALPVNPVSHENTMLRCSSFILTIMYVN